MLETKYSPAIFRQIPIEYLQRGKYQPRQDFPQEGLLALAETVKRDGILEPLLVRPLTGNYFEIIAGERRWRAAQIACLHEVPCLIRNYSDEEAARIALIENTNRENLNPIAEAQAICRIISEFGYTHEEMAAAIGKPRPVVSNLLRLLKLDSRVQELLRRGDLSEAHGKLLAALPHERQYHFAYEAYSKCWSTRSLEIAVKNESRNKKATVIGKKDFHLTKIENQLSDIVGHPVFVKFNRNKSGMVSISFHNTDSLEAILMKLGYADIE